ncbi:hypothetical protein TIFTF001_029743 [Ficus carica]|uniref:Uncharacterized protein n=1 Tax=Ficus carica TaxID=3494 RepID=A0AA88DS74_FICCA|nr:hypothetical protein TIFTF001_029743 [Ficus carica]
MRSSTPESNRVGPQLVSTNGQISPHVGNLSFLKTLDLQNNRNSSTNWCFVPASSSTPCNLEWRNSCQHIALLQPPVPRPRNLTGTVPSSLYNLSSIQIFSVHTNLLVGTLHPDLGHTLPNLEAFYFHLNRFTGQIPVSISNASKLSLLQVSTNDLTGKVPSFQGLSNLYMLTIHKNNLRYDKEEDLNFVYSLMNCTNLQVIAINDNKFRGVLPKTISNFSTGFNLLAFERNQITGSIPSGIRNLINLVALGLESNHLSGPLPDTIGKLRKLNSLSLEDI